MEVALEEQQRQAREVVERREKVEDMRQEAEKFWNDKASLLEEEIKQRKEDIEMRETQLFLVPQLDDDDTGLPPGPTCLLFLEGNGFTVIATLVIIANMVTMVMEML